MRDFSAPALRARLIIASSSRKIVFTGSCRGGSLAQVSGCPRMWLRIKPASPLAATRAIAGSKVKPEGSLMISTP